MGKTLIVAEKPSVGRDIARVLGVRGRGDGMMTGDKYIVSWAIGHLVTLCEPDEIDPALKKWTMDSLPILPDVLPTKVIDKTKKQFGVLKKLLNDRDVDEVICATDSGREGELIFRYIYDRAGCVKPVQRLWISSMTDNAIRDGFAALRPDSEYDGLYTSARCRSEADWLVGMNASRAYTIRYGALLSVGRVQTPTLALLVARDREIRAFVPRDYWEVHADFGDYEGLWFDPETKESRLFDREKAQAIADAVRGREGAVVENTREMKKTPPPQLYDLTSLQREANKAHGLSASRTLNIVQSLYEKHKLVTYPRTDSRYLPNDMTGKVGKVISTLPAPWAQPAQPLKAMDRLPHPFRVYNDAKVSDHHAIVPTGNYAALGKLTDPEMKIFDMIARRLLAVHYPDYEYLSVCMITEVEGERFRTQGAIPVKPGWHQVYPAMSEKDEGKPLPDLPVGTRRTVRSVAVKALKTKPPQAHTDATLLQAMENAGRTLEDEELRESMKDSGLGTPATRAAIIDRLIQVGYAERHGRTLTSTEKGGRLISVAPEELASPVITGKWEKSLSRMAKEKDPAAMADLSGRFMDGIRRYAAFLVEQARDSKTDVAFDKEPRRAAKGRKPAAKVKELDIVCPVCGQGKVTENSKAFSCTRWKEGCGMTIWKECLVSRGGPVITSQLAGLIIEKREVRGSTGIIRYEPGSLPLFEPNENAVIPEKKPKPAAPPKRRSKKTNKE